MNTTTPLESAAQLREAAKTEFDQRNPRPEPPTPPTVARPSVVKVGMAHVWVETLHPSERQTAARVQFNLVVRQGSDPIFFDGGLAPDELDALISQLQAAKAIAETRQAHLEANKVYEEKLRAWEQGRDEFARQRESEWQKAQKK